MNSETLTQNLAQVRERIEAAARAAGRDPDTVTLLPVSKTVPVERLRHGIDAGLRRFGENRVQEVCEKVEVLGASELDWVVIGHLQSNKARDVARFASEVQSVDRLKIARALDKHLQDEGRCLDVLLQVNTSGEASKYGVEPDVAAELLEQVAPLPNLRVRGLMTLALFSEDKGAVRACFQRLRALRDRLREQAPSGVSLDRLSMGMSGDYELAIAEGATEVRVGTAIFGQRPTSDSYYWPGSVPE